MIQREVAKEQWIIFQNTEKQNRWEWSEMEDPEILNDCNNLIAIIVKRTA